MAYQRFSMPLLLSLLLACSPNEGAVKVENDWFEAKPQFISDGFDHPVGPPDGQGYYNAQGFGENKHLGDDWNGVGGGNSDIGDPVYAIANGHVTQAEDVGGGWGNVIRIVHAMEHGDSLSYVESFYAHCDTILVTAGAGIKRGEQIGTIGDAHGKYLAHLHFEIRDQIGMKIGPGYSENREGYLDPSAFLQRH